MLAASSAEWVAIRSALILGRGVDNWVRRLLALPAFPDGSADRRIQVVHLDDVLRLCESRDPERENRQRPSQSRRRRVRRHSVRSPPALRRPIVPSARPTGPRSTRRTGMRAKRAVDGYLAAARRVGIPAGVELRRMRRGFRTGGAWPGHGGQAGGIAAVAAGQYSGPARGRCAVRATAWRPDWPAQQRDNGEFDTPIDPRFPTFLATNLSEALPGPFSPSSASATVRGLRAGGVTIAERLRPGGMVQREIAMRTVAVFAHRLYGAITSAHFMAETVPFVKPPTVVSNSGFFGPSMASLPIFGEERPPTETSRTRRQLRTAPQHRRIRRQPGRPERRFAPRHPRVRGRRRSPGTAGR